MFSVVIVIGCVETLYIDDFHTGNIRLKLNETWHKVFLNIGKSIGKITPTKKVIYWGWITSVPMTGIYNAYLILCVKTNIMKLRKQKYLSYRWKRKLLSVLTL